ncbi:Qdr2p [Sugiyamaella lignohabitans]|uniref:Qdr2p n=1 Tax=Sugiyamaella lignohabitans TaxID=796027 RepID=A0A167F432_9ASCO|nr:Qdr2p [Sugiyamaella lignohabitans]ANB14805.1 Qdr2p [Sugiyamaella lignohabitans]
MSSSSTVGSSPLDAGFGSPPVDNRHELYSESGGLEDQEKRLEGHGQPESEKQLEAGNESESQNQSQKLQVNQRRVSDHDLYNDHENGNENHPIPLSLGPKDEENQNEPEMAKITTNASSFQPPVTIYGPYERYLITGIASWAAFFSTVSVPIYLPAFSAIGADFHVSTEKLNLTVTVYSVFQGLSPAFWAPMSDAYGRRPVYFLCFMLYIGACIGLALAKDYWTIFGLRMLQAAGIASTVATLNGVIADITSRRNRGIYMGISGGIGLLGNCFGPIIGGGITQGMGWRSIFWFLVIAACVTLLAIVFLLPETNRFIAGDGSIYPSNVINMSPYAFIRHKTRGVPFIKGEPEYDPSVIPERTNRVSFFGTIKLLRELDVVLVLIPNALHYTTWFMVLTSMSSLLSSEYGFSSSKVGLAYLASGAGSLLGSIVSGRLMTYRYRKVLAQFKADCAAKGKPVNMHEFTIQKARMDVTMAASIILCGSCIIYGWTIQKHVHYIVPILSTFLTSSSATYVINTSSTLLVDLFPNESASSTAVVNLTRCLLCAVGLAVVDKMIRSLGAGGAFTLMSGICILSMALIQIEINHGQKIDRRRRARKGLDNQRL